jgi:hypothetical protein
MSMNPSSPLNISVMRAVFAGECFELNDIYLSLSDANLTSHELEATVDDLIVFLSANYWFSNPSAIFSNLMLHRAFNRNIAEKILNPDLSIGLDYEMITRLSDMDEKISSTIWDAAIKGNLIAQTVLLDRMKLDKGYRASFSKWYCKAYKADTDLTDMPSEYIAMTFGWDKAELE